MAVKRLLDKKLSARIVYKITDLYPDSEQVKTWVLTNTDDGIIWEYAKANDFVIVSKVLTFISAV
jgi:predicted nuclease of predicted toxin-antitoxin system